MNRFMLENAMEKYQQEEDVIRHIMIDKLKEMAKVKPDDFIDYPKVCSVMNEIAELLLRR